MIAEQQKELAVSLQHLADGHQTKIAKMLRDLSVGKEALVRERKALARVLRRAERCRIVLDLSKEAVA